MASAIARIPRINKPPNSSAMEFIMDKERQRSDMSAVLATQEEPGISYDSGFARRNDIEYVGTCVVDPRLKMCWRGERISISTPVGTEVV